MAADDAGAARTDSELRWALQHLPPEARSVSQARRGARAAVEAWGLEDLDWLVAQLVSEVATNAVLHAGTPFDVMLRFDGHRLRCEVADTSPRLPRTRHYASDSTTGRGLHLLAELSSDWGVDRRGDGKTVWFELVHEQDVAEAVA